MTCTNADPGAAGTATGAKEYSATTTDEPCVLHIRHHLNGDVSFTFSGTGPRHVLSGRCAWAFRELVQAGSKGCTAVNNPAPRWAAYVHKLRHTFRFPVETISEPHGKPFPGSHARYVLRATVIEDGYEVEE